MTAYYLDENGRLFQTGGSFVEVFDACQKDWRVEDWQAAQWLETHLPELTRIDEAAAEEHMAQQLLANLDRKTLEELIQALRKHGKVIWEPMKQNPDGSYRLGYPKYPADVFQALDLLGFDGDYRRRMEQRGRNLRIGEMDVLQIRAKLTYLGRAERFCDGVIADAVDNGTMLRLLERLKQLAEKE